MDKGLFSSHMKPPVNREIDCHVLIRGWFEATVGDFA